MKCEGKVEPKGNAVKRRPTTALEKVRAKGGTGTAKTEMGMPLVEKYVASKLRDEVTS